MNRSKITRREFIGGLAATGALANAEFGQTKLDPKIDRFALVSRHNPVLRKFEPLSPLSVGNGEFAFTCDVTGLQTFPDQYKDAMPLCTMSQWGWHTTPMPEHLKGKELRLTEYETYDRKVGYSTGRDDQEELFNWLRENPHRLHLGQIGFEILRANGERVTDDITDIEQKLDLWTGIIESRFKVEGHLVSVKTAVHPTRDVLAVTAKSALIASARLAIRIDFPYGSPTMQAADWTKRESHLSLHTKIGNSYVIRRKLNNDNYVATVNLAETSQFVWMGLNTYTISAETKEHLDVIVSFSPNERPAPVDPDEVFAASRTHWKNFWTNGAAIDLSGSKDPRANELERRVVLSQYLTAIQCSGSLPPQETGLTTNSWYGKYHLEMHWWHSAQFALWNRLPMLEKSLGWYAKILPSAKEKARQQGYTGARWPKMTSPDARDSPSPIGPLLIWQQPHPIFYAELAYLSRPTRATLRQYQSIVFESAEFMASYAHFDKQRDRYVLGPPVIPAQENHPPRETWNPTFELEYWNYGLKTANKWLERLGLKRNPKWDEVVAKLSPLPVGDGVRSVSSPHVSRGSRRPPSALTHVRATNTMGVYLAHENCPQTFAERNRDHPSMLAAYGVLPGEMADRETMRRTLKKVMKEWDWPETWGWDYPMTAMTAARLGETETAIDALLLDTSKNRYLPNGHNYQRPNLPLYLPGNGGLLYAIALMTNGWKGSPKRPAPGFPSDGSWTVRSEGFNIALFAEI